MSRTVPTGASPNGDTSPKGDVVILPRDAIDIVKGRREEFETLVKDAETRLQFQQQQWAVCSFFDDVCATFRFEGARIFVTVIGHDVPSHWGCERRRLQEARDFLNKQVWLDRDRDRDDPCAGRVCCPEDSVLGGPTPDAI